MKNHPFMIRAFKKTDAFESLKIHYEAVHQLASNSYSKEILEAWSPLPNDKRLEKFLISQENHISRFIVENDDNIIIGFSEIILDKNLIGACYVSPLYHRKGVGSYMLKFLEDHSQIYGLDSLEVYASINARLFYEHNGYKSLKYIQHAVSNTTLFMKAIHMKKTLR